MAESFKTGDVVQLKSGGPRMTVGDAEASSGSILCHWFNQDGGVWTPQHAGFKREELVLVDRD
ncbi:MAG: hypothetical protein ABS35_03970 [Kaistia sp. SCN 65-12]|nr:MAG: hypothetical protein ABS35_03970 [Kaistia sp. SCN 65-12]